MSSALAHEMTAKLVIDGTKTGEVADEVEVDVPAMIHVTGSCNPCFHATGAHYINGDTTAFMQFITHRSGKSAGSIRVSLGIASTFGDVARLLAFVEGLRDQTQLTIGEATFDIASCRVIRDGS